MRQLSVSLIMIFAACRTENVPVAQQKAIGEPGEFFGKPVLITEMTSTEQGVFYESNGALKIVLELRDGHYRYWLGSDLQANDLSGYHLQGMYTAIGPNITLCGVNPPFNQWRFRKMNEVKTLWSLGAARTWRDQERYGTILLPIRMKAEEAWEEGPPNEMLFHSILNAGKQQR